MDFAPLDDGRGKQGKQRGSPTGDRSRPHDGTLEACPTMAGWKSGPLTGWEPVPLAA